VLQRERQLQRRDAGARPKGAADGKQAPERRQLEQLRKQTSIGNKPKEYGRFD